MAGYPAGDPFADTNKVHGLDGNPFDDDAAIRQATTLPHAYPYASEEDAYEEATPTKPTGRRADDTATRLEEIRRREIELEQRERTLGQREEHIRNYGKNNWPPFYPLFFHSIEQEIPADKQADVRTIYRGWLFLILVLIWNLVSAILLLTSGAANGGADLGSGIVYLPVVGILSFLLWYRPVYSAYAREASVFYILFFVFNGFHIAFCIYMLVGIPSTGSAGIINTVSAFSRGSIVTGVFGTIDSVGWAVLSLGNLILYKAVWKHWSDKGHTFAQAQNEVATHGLRAYFGRSSAV